MNTKNNQNLNERAAADRKLIHKIDLNVIAEKWPAIWKHFAAYCDEFLMPGWRDKYTYGEHQSMFYMWFGGFCCARSIRPAAKIEFPDKVKRKQWFKEFNEDVDKLLAYIDGNLTQDEPGIPEDIKRMTEQLEKVLGIKVRPVNPEQLGEIISKTIQEAKEAANAVRSSQSAKDFFASLNELSAKLREKRTQENNFEEGSIAPKH